MAGLKKNSNPGVIIQKEHSDSAGNHRVAEHGFVVGVNAVSGQDGIHDDISTATFVGENRHLLLTNTSGAVIYVKFGDSSVAVPTAADGVPLLAGSQLRLCSGENTYIRSSAALHCVEIED